ncbi:MAG: hypothetical protein FJ279_00670, partial [Planctomycetes bacterium]|nr:hypothetical protein [Planctomycetota bacterium]
MRAAVNAVPSDPKAIGGWVVKEVPLPQPAAGQVVVEVRACAFCGSDHKFLNAQGVRFTPGHEFAGVIAQLGEGVSGWSVGDRVVANPFIYCGECAPCRSGKQNLCDHHVTLGFQGHGAFAERVAVRASNVIRLPDNVPFEVAALADPIAVDIHALNLVDLSAVKTAVVLGLGGIGFPAAMLLQKRCEVIGIETARQKMEIARRFRLEVLDG